MYGLLQRWSRKEIIGIIVIGIIAIISFAFPHFIFSNTTFLSQHNNNPVTIWVKSEEFANENIWVVLSKGPEKAEHGLPVKEGHPPIDAKVGSDNYVITVFGGEEMSFNSSDTERTPKVSFDVEIPNMWSFYYTGYGKVNFIVDLDRENIEKKLFPLGR